MKESKFWAYSFLVMSAIWAPMAVSYYLREDMLMAAIAVVNTVLTGFISRREFLRG